MGKSALPMPNMVRSPGTTVSERSCVQGHRVVSHTLSSIWAPILSTFSFLGLLTKVLARDIFQVLADASLETQKGGFIEERFLPF